MKSTFKDEDVTLLLKDITGLVEPQSTEEREKLIQSGKHYCEMLPIEYKPTEKYLEIYEKALSQFSQKVADGIAILAERIKADKGNNVALVSLARAGTPIGILIKHYIKNKYNLDWPHYSISIIRGKGIDKNAIRFMLKECYTKSIQFIDGWTGKGAIYRELRRQIDSYFPQIDYRLGVIADPVYATPLCGTHEDILIPSSCLNSTVCGLISRTFLRDDIITGKDFHGACYYGELQNEDKTYEFINHIESLFNYNIKVPEDDYSDETKWQGLDDVAILGDKYHVKDINLIKPGIGETTRVLLRRVPWKVIINIRYKDNKELECIYQLAKEKNVEIEYMKLNNYKCCGLIKQLADA